ncbi:MAG TPA: hypothetical protein VH679_02545 [Vicinamibacterales bacterium]|jgi:hypothetical protein
MDWSSDEDQLAHVEYDLQYRDRKEDLMGKYMIAWLLGVPASVLAVIYLVSHAGC